MKKKIFLRILVVILACLMLLPLLCSCAAGSRDYTEYASYMEESCEQWTVSDDGSKLASGEKVYKRIDTDCKIEPMYAYRFYNMVSLDESGFYMAWVEVPSKEAESEIAWLKGDYEDSYIVYATEKGEAALKEFETGKYYCATLVNPESAWNFVDISLLEDLDGASIEDGNKKQTDVTDLKDIERLELRVYDSTESFYKAYGALYNIEESWYYVNYDSLGNEYFDADGNFSYRRGTVELSLLNDALSKKINAACEHLEVLYTVYTYEESEYMTYSEYQGEDSSLGVVIFWVVYALLCFALPAAFVVLGCVFARIEKFGRPKYWYVVSALALAWILVSIVLAIVIAI